MKIPTNHLQILSDLTSITVIFCMINQTLKVKLKVNFETKIEKVQYKACMAITGAI